MATHHVLLLGGTGKIAQMLTPLLLKRSWSVTSLIHSPERADQIRKLGGGAGAGKLDTLVKSLAEVKSEADAKAIIDQVKPDYVVWSAGAAGKGGPEMTYAIDRDAATYFIRAAASTPTVTKFLLVSYAGSRRAKPSWWTDETWAQTVRSAHADTSPLATYHRAKLAADEALRAAASSRPSDFAAIDLRPGQLTLDPAGGVELGRTKSPIGPSSREAVARVADQLLAKMEVGNVWVDMLDGQEEIEAAVERVVREKVDAGEGEPSA